MDFDKYDKYRFDGIFFPEFFWYGGHEMEDNLIELKT